MGRGSRHSKNAGVMGSEALTYHERKGMGHGTLKERLGKVRSLKFRLPTMVTVLGLAVPCAHAHAAESLRAVQDAQGDYFACSLTLQQARVRSLMLASPCEQSVSDVASPLLEDLQSWSSGFHSPRVLRARHHQSAPIAGQIALTHVRRTL
jgi:hypothetical protein